MLVGLSGTVIDAPVGALVADAHEVDFGTVTVAAVTKQGLTLRNTGSASAALGEVTVTGPGAAVFGLASGCAPGTVLAPGAACTAELQVRPGADTVYAAALQWRSNGTNPAPVRLTARGRAPSTEGPGPGTSGPGGDGGGGGGCAALPPARVGDASLLLWLAGALVALAGRRRRPPCDSRVM